MPVRPSRPERAHPDPHWRRLRSSRKPVTVIRGPFRVDDDDEIEKTLEEIYNMVAIYNFELMQEI